MRNERIAKAHVAKENARLIAQNAILEAEQLKFQLQPHTLINILSNLKAVAKKLDKGMTSLSDTLEYILYKGKGNLVSVEDELIFMRRYLDLNDLFLSQLDSIRFDDSKVEANSIYYRKPCLPHLVTGYLIENAFKHGDAKHPEFMQISVALKGDSFELRVANKLLKTKHNRPGGIGLVNMRKRMDLILAGKYEIRQHSNETDYVTTLLIKLA